jgi:hypothetical protein
LPSNRTTTWREGKFQADTNLGARVEGLNELCFHLYRENLPAIEVPETMRFNGRGIPRLRAALISPSFFRLY